MQKNRFSSFSRLLIHSLSAALAVGVTTVPLALIGRQTLGEAVIALLYLVPVAWSASRWGLIPGMSAALTAALCFDFFFIPPFHTLVVGSLEGWLVLAIFLGVAFIVVERIQVSLSRAREAVFMYELSAALSSQRTQEAVAHTVAREIQQLFQATLVNVVYHPGASSPSIAVSVPVEVSVSGRPDRILPLLNSWGLAGEIQIWKGAVVLLPVEDSRLLQDFAAQAARAFERTQPVEIKEPSRGLAVRPSTK
jgi:K+-sensing histidine kinase KdpD